MNQPFFSIIIPTKRRPKELEDVLKDFAAQHMDPNLFEVLIFNDEHDLATERLAQKAWPFRVQYFFSDEKTNSCRSRNICLDHAEGEWIVFLDDDVRFDKTFLTWAKEQSNIFSFFTPRIIKPPEKTTKAGIVKLATQTLWLGRTMPLFGFFIAGFDLLKSKPTRTDHLPGIMIVKHALVKTVRFDEWIGEGTGYLDDTDFSHTVQTKNKIVPYFLSTFTILHLQASSGGNREHDVKRWYYYYQAHKVYFFRKHFPFTTPCVLLWSFIECCLRCAQKRTNLLPTYVRATRDGLAQAV
ncbi:MAG: glycosyltransferase family 2 protein [Candidatus Uhrbacteria bacterium]|nr:glycosyltransferase family 2 protein [Candidatus Uhrbacteria bacterium]